MSDVLTRLFATIEARKSEDPETSYTASLFAKGPAKCAEKFGEEAVEAIIAAVQGDEDGLRAEAADVLYHLQVLLSASNLRWEDVLATLEARAGTSGHAEKASRRKR